MLMPRVANSPSAPCSVPAESSSKSKQIDVLSRPVRLASEGARTTNRVSLVRTSSMLRPATAAPNTSAARKLDIAAAARSLASMSRTAAAVLSDATVSASGRCRSR